MTAPTRAHDPDRPPRPRAAHPASAAGGTVEETPFTHLTHTTGDGYLRVTLDRPARQNALDTTTLGQLDQALSLAEGGTDCRVLVLTAAGNSFCAGMDIHAPTPVAEHATPEDGSAAGSRELPYWRLLERLTTTELVTVALVDGDATGGGVGLAAACDLVLAGERARFRLTEVLLGLVPAMALPFVARRIGEQRAFRAALLAEALDSRVATETGLADLCGPTAEQLLSPLLASLRRVDRATAAALKHHRGTLFPLRPGVGEEASALFLERLADPTVASTLARLRTDAAQHQPKGAP